VGSRRGVLSCLYGCLCAGNDGLRGVWANGAQLKGVLRVEAALRVTAVLRSSERRCVVKTAPL
jgi:hypothetical protein